MTNFIIPVIIKAKEELKMKKGRHRKDCSCEKCIAKKKEFNKVIEDAGLG